MLATSFVATRAAADSVDPKVCIDATDAGQQLRDTGKYRAARAQFATCAQEGCPAPIRHDCQGWLDDVDQRMPTIVFGARSHGRDVGDVHVSLDGDPFTAALDGRPLTIDPGTHRLHFEPPGDVDVEQTVVVRSGEKSRLFLVSFDPEPLPPPPYVPGPPTMAYVLAGVGVAGAAAFGILAGLGYSEYNDCKNTPHNTCNVSSARSTANDFWIPGDISLGVGLVAGGIATWLFLKPRSAPSARIGITPTLGGGMARASFEF